MPTHTETATPVVFMIVHRDTVFAPDVVGSLVTEDGEVLWTHISSTPAWLREDLTVNYRSRKNELALRYPDGYRLVELSSTQELPDAALDNLRYIMPRPR